MNNQSENGMFWSVNQDNGDMPCPITHAPIPFQEPREPLSCEMSQESIESPHPSPKMETHVHTILNSYRHIMKNSDIRGLSSDTLRNHRIVN